MGRHPTIWDFKVEIRHRIPARISPWGSRGLNPNFLSFILDPKMPKSIFSGRVLKLLAPQQWIWGPRGPKGAPRGPRGPKEPKGPPSDPTGPHLSINSAKTLGSLGGQFCGESMGPGALGSLGPKGP